MTTFFGEEVGMSGRRRHRILAGSGMLAVRQSFTFDGERYKAGLTRIAPDHSAAQAHPDKLGPANPKEDGFEVLRWLEWRERERYATPGHCLERG